MYRLTQLCRTRFAATVAASVLALSLSGCTSLPDYIHNGFKVGPNYCKPPAPVAKHWIDAADMRAPNVPGIQCRWWTVFHDPKLDELIACAYRQNLTLREAGFRILAARAALNIQIGNLFPQDQIARGAYTRSATPTGPTTPVAYTSFWSYGFNLNWQLDFWGRFRRAVAAAEDTLDARVADYDAAVVTMLGDVASNYVRIRTTQERIDLLRANVKLQQGVLDFIEARLAAGYRQTNLDRAQALSNLRQDEAAIPVLEIAKRQYEDALCVLLGIPAVSIEPMLGIGPIPVSPPDVALGIPCDLLRRRPDVRSAERLAAAQAEAIGIAEADLYPSFFINGSLGYSAQFFPDLFRNTAFTGSVGPSFQWNVLNYGRIINNVRLQDATFQQLVAVYQQTVITASQEVEDGIIAFLKSQRASRLLDESVAAAKEAVDVVVAQYMSGTADFNRYATIEQNMVTQQDQAAQSRGNIALGLIQTYQALGGGWEIRFCGPLPPPPPPANGAAPQPGVPNGMEQLPLPLPTPPNTPQQPAAPQQPAGPQQTPPPAQPPAFLQQSAMPQQPAFQQQPAAPQQQPGQPREPFQPWDPALPQEPPLSREPSASQDRSLSGGLTAGLQMPSEMPWLGDGGPPNRAP